MAGAVGHQRVPLEFIQSYPIPIPPISEQKRIVAVLDKLSAEKQSLVGIYEKKISVLAELKQSLLHKAFTGELTAHPNAADRTFSEAGA
ncbi:restriction endonuclease subunit S [Candidatus Spongiihabitans sp.]|uniref:restriction endonuclease subunit S n=1 Tax=Candidatus Spongiihabitans sp. TaxID=3101308 RepID=UPI003C6EBDE0